VEEKEAGEQHEAVAEIVVARLGPAWVGGDVVGRRNGVSGEAGKLRSEEDRVALSLAEGGLTVLGD